jgi:RNA polymerase sigma factor (sigma-70 family)
MAKSQGNVVVTYLRKLVDGDGLAEATDAQLLERFVVCQEEPAFTALLRRHGPMVLSVCRRILHNDHDAEDVFQATFLILARKAGSIRKHESVGSWLHGVARRLSLRTRSRAESRKAREARAAERRGNLEPAWTELNQVLDSALRALPAKYREVLVLCYLEGNTQEESARQLGCPLGTVRSRLAQGRALLRQRLARHGLTLSVAAFTTLLATCTPAQAVPVRLLDLTLPAAVEGAGGKAVAAGLVSARVAGLVNADLVSMAAAKVGLAAAALATTACVVVLGWAVFRQPTASESPKTAERPMQTTQPTASQPRPAAKAHLQTDDDRSKMTVTAHVVDSQGKAVDGASVAVLAWRNSPWAGGELSEREIVLDQAKTDRDGHVRLRLPRTDSVQFQQCHIVACASAHGLGWVELNPDASRREARIELPPETAIAGRIVDVHGQPAVGVKVFVSGLGGAGRGELRGLCWDQEPEGLSAWPAPATTDAQGRFLIRGVNRNSGVSLAIRDARFARQSVAVNSQDISVTLSPARFLEGRILFADSGTPAANARLFAAVDAEENGGGRARTNGVRTDDQGRFKVRLEHGKDYLVTAFAPDAEPYLPIRKKLAWPKGAVRHTLDVVLPRGVLVRGKVTEAGSGAPITGAGIYYRPLATNAYRRPETDAVTTGLDNGVLAAKDGSFRIAVLPGQGHVLVSGPTSDYIRLETKDLYSGGAGGRPLSPHGLVSLDPKPGSEPLEVSVALRRGIRISGRLLSADGSLVSEALMFCRLNDRPWFFDSHPRLSHADIHDGRFEVRGLDPDKSYPIYFLDAANKLAARTVVSGRDAGKPLQVHLLPCGAAILRILDTRGKPVANIQPPVEMVIAGGAFVRADADQPDRVRADSESLVNLDRLNYGKLRTDASGSVTLLALIPGATYRLTQWTGTGWGHTDFSVEAGRTHTLPDLILKPSE